MCSDVRTPLTPGKCHRQGLRSAISDSTDHIGDARMAREPDELVEMRRVLGAQLAAYRQAAELSQGQLAIATKVDRTTVAHIEKGPLPRRRTPRTPGSPTVPPDGHPGPGRGPDDQHRCR